MGEGHGCWVSVDLYLFTLISGVLDDWNFLIYILSVLSEILMSVSGWSIGSAISSFGQICYQANTRPSSKEYEKPKLYSVLIVSNWYSTTSDLDGHLIYRSTPDESKIGS
jgi:hypothetical protein